MHPVVFTGAALAELVDAQDWYESESTGLGRQFRTEVDAAVERMSARPRQFPSIYENLRRALVRRFPYSLLFVLEPDETLTVIACFHASRDPEQWRKRM
jgi:plasmid stabilization system protein ParE